MSVRSIEAEVSIKSGVQAECTIGREVVVEIHDDVNLESLDVTANGSYRPSQGVDGFSDVTVAVPERIPVTESLSVTQNGTYEPTESIDGYDRVTVSVPPTIPDIEPLTVTANGVYTASGDGFNPVTVNVPIPTDPNVCEGEFIGTETGVLTIDTGYVGDAYPKVISICPVSGVMRMDDDFWRNISKNAINVITYIKYRDSNPTYSVDNPSNFNRMCFAYCGKINASQYSGSYGISHVLTDEDNNGMYGAGNCVRMPNNHTLKIFVSPTAGKERLSTDIRYKYQVIY